MTSLLPLFHDAMKHGHKKVLIHTVDTYVVVLEIAAAKRLNHIEIWIAFSTGKNFRHFQQMKLLVPCKGKAEKGLKMFCKNAVCENSLTSDKIWSKWPIIRSF